MDPNWTSAHSITMTREPGTCTLRYGITSGVHGNEEGEILVLDIDHYTVSELQHEQILPLLDNYHHWNHRIFRWAAGDALIDGMRSSAPETDGTIYGTV